MVPVIGCHVEGCRTPEVLTSEERRGCPLLPQETHHHCRPRVVSAAIQEDCLATDCRAECNSKGMTETLCRRLQIGQ